MYFLDTGFIYAATNVKIGSMVVAWVSFSQKQTISMNTFVRIASEILLLISPI